MKQNQQIIFILLLTILSATHLKSYRRAHSEAYSYAYSGQAFASASAGAGAFASAGGPTFASAGPGASTSTNVSSDNENSASSSSSSSSMTSENGKTSYKIQTSVKTNNDPEIKTKIESDDINKQPKKSVKIGGKKVDGGNSKQNNKNSNLSDNERKNLKLALFFIKNLLRKIGYDVKFIEKCASAANAKAVHNAINVVNKIGKQKKGYENLGSLSTVCKGLDDISERIQDKNTLEKVKEFIEKNI